MMATEEGTPPRARISRIPELDLLRFFAAASVMIYHYTYRPVINSVVDEHAFWPLPVATRFGYQGVTLFFMISGFVILWSSQGRSAGEFAISRIARLFPSFWICVLITALVVNATGGGPILPRTIALNLTMVPGALGAPYVDGVYWTLFVELKFYVLIYFVLVTDTMARVEAWLAVWLAASAVSTFGIAPKWLASVALGEFGPYFISGCLFYLLRASGPSLFRVGALLLACALGAVSAVKDQSGFMHEPTPLSTFVVAASVVVFHALFGAIALIPRILPSSRWWYWLGTLTYPLYLLHNRIGKIISANLSAAHSMWVSLAVELTVVLAASAIISAAIERRACGAFHEGLLRMAIYLRAVRPRRA